MATKKKEAPAKTPAKDENSDAWFSTGATGLAAKKAQDAIASARKERAVGRFFLKEGEKALITFLSDEEGFYLYEHNLKLNGRWGNFATCTKDWKPCPVCEAGFKPTFTAYYTIIDHREFELKTGQRAGTKVKNRKLLYPAKGSAMTIVAELRKRYKSLAGKTFEVIRRSADDPNCGRDFELKGTLSADQIAKIAKAANVPVNEFKEPIPYKKVLAPLKETELAGMGFGQTTIGAEEEVVGGSNLDGLVNID